MVAAQTSIPAAEPPAGSRAVRSRVAVPRRSAWWVLIAGVLGLAAASALTIEKIKLLADSKYVPSCSLNPVLSCGSVMSHWQAQVFGFPNPLIGIVAFTVVVVTGVLAVAKVLLPRWYWVGLAAGALLGVVFIHWLIFESLYRIDALCPYCMVVWAVTIPLLVVVSSVASAPGAANPVTRTLHRFRWPLVVLWFTAVILLILVQFWDYWSTLL